MQGMEEQPCTGVYQAPARCHRMSIQLREVKHLPKTTQHSHPCGSDFHRS